MAANNTYSDISSFVNSIYEDALAAAREMNIMTNLVRVFDDRTGMAPRKIQQYGTATINSIAETDDLASQAYTPVALSTLTPAEAGGQYLLTDQRLETDPFGVREDAALELGAAMADKFETDLVGTFSSLTGGTVGAAGTIITWGHFFAMRSQLKVRKAPPPYTFVCHDYQWHILAKAVTPAAGAQTNAPNFQDDVMRRWYVGTVAGVDIFTTSHTPVNSLDDAYAAMFSRDAIALDLRRRPRLEPERDASRRAWELNMTAVYAFGVWRPLFGIQGIFDASTPSS